MTGTAPPVLGRGRAVGLSQMELVMLSFRVSTLLRRLHGRRKNTRHQRGHLGDRVASATAESHHHGRTTPTGKGTGIGTGIDATEVALVLGVVAVVVRLRLLMRATVEVLLRGLEASLHHFRPAQIRFV